MSSVKSVVISCAGFGSRLGLSTTKALLKIGGMSLIGWQLQLFRDVEDVRVVVGFQANEVIREVNKFRRDVIFVFNHNYFETNTGASFYLGARDGYEYALEYDGDLLVHPDDMQRLLNSDGEWIAYADKLSEDGVYVKTDEQGRVLKFSRNEGDYEWTGPCCIKKDRLSFTSGHVYNQLEPYLPMKGIKIRACDIDTVEDYRHCQETVKSWGL